MPNRNTKNDSTSISSTLLEKIKSLRNQTPREQFKRDIAVWDAYLSSPSLERVSVKRKEIVKRIFLILSRLKVTLNCTYHIPKHAQTNLPVAALLSHGGRILLQVPPTQDNKDKDKLLEWIVGGKQNIYAGMGVLLGKVGDTAAKKGMPVFQRAAATHRVVIEGNEAREIFFRIDGHGWKGGTKNLTYFLMNLYKAQNMGVNLGLYEPNQSAVENGSYGHLYLHWRPPTKKHPGALLIGCEGSEYGKIDRFGAKHSTKAFSAEISPTGGLKFRCFDFASAGIDIADLNGMRVELDQATVNEVVKWRVDQYNAACLAQNVRENILPPLCSTSLIYQQIDREPTRFTSTKEMASPVNPKKITSEASVPVNQPADHDQADHDQTQEQQLDITTIRHPYRKV